MSCRESTFHLWAEANVVVYLLLLSFEPQALLRSRDTKQSSFPVSELGEEKPRLGSISLPCGTCNPEAPPLHLCIHSGLQSGGSPDSERHPPDTHTSCCRSGIATTTWDPGFL